MMKKIATLLGFSFAAVALTACQTAPRAYNGQVGYQVEAQNSDQATLAYTLAGRQNQELDKTKLERACQKVLKSQKNYKIKLLSINEIANPAAVNTESYGRQIGQSKTTFGLSNTPQLHSTDDYATREALNARPSTLRVVRYTCS